MPSLQTPAGASITSPRPRLFNSRRRTVPNTRSLRESLGDGSGNPVEWISSAATSFEFLRGPLSQQGMSRQPTVS